MGLSVHCAIVSAEQEIFSGLAEMVIAVGEFGDLGIAHGHAPLLTSLQPGPVRVIKQGGEEEIFYVSGGFLEVQPDAIHILSDTAQRAADVDEAAAQEARRAAESELAKQSSELDYSTTTVQLARAVAQLRTIEQLRRKVGR